MSNTGRRPFRAAGTRRLGLIPAFTWVLTQPVAVAAFLVSLLALPAAGQEGQRVWEGTVVVRTLNVRGGPGGGFTIVDELKRGAAIEAVDQSGRWVRLKGAVPAWVHESFVRLPEDFMAPEFTPEEDKFLDWAGEQSDLEELSVEGDGRLSVVLVRDPARQRAEILTIAQTVGCAYRDQAGIAGAVTVTVWPAKGPASGWILQATCPSP